ncbi:transmembrane ascorbate-dependent reductase CYB561 isoform X5 [Temnothorax nylanderi]|uniref:transmembrane ascorbate-dependent reductase CYB561 isoform X5 n=1 Tax=Temnothorax nylanderi TaxID=102681 RepID=UPI003A8A6D99
MKRLLFLCTHCNSHIWNSYGIKHMEQIRESPQTESHSLEGFIPLLSITEGCGALLVILVIVWTSFFRNGFSWRSNPELEFNWHPLLMTIGLVFLYANGKSTELARQFGDTCQRSVLQWFAGCVSFLYPGLQSPLRASYMPMHVYFGVAAFVSAIASCLLGLNEKAIFTLKDKYSAFVSEGMLINFIGLLLIAFGGLTTYLVTQERYRRLPRPEDEVLLSG